MPLGLAMETINIKPCNLNGNPGLQNDHDMASFRSLYQLDVLIAMLEYRKGMEKTDRDYVNEIQEYLLEHHKKKLDL